MSDIFFPDMIPKKVVYICPICSSGNISYGECTNCNSINVKVSNANNQNQTKPSREVQKMVSESRIKRKRRNKKSNGKQRKVFSSSGQDGQFQSEQSQVEKEIKVKF